MKFGYLREWLLRTAISAATATLLEATEISVPSVSSCSKSVFSLRLCVFA
jgi:hypothetical protein